MQGNKVHFTRELIFYSIRTAVSSFCALEIIDQNKNNTPRSKRRLRC